MAGVDKNRLLDTLFSQNASLPYQTNLPDSEKFAFADWVSRNNVPLDLGPRSDYDMPGFFQDKTAESGVSDIDGRMHFTDRYKTPNHATFSAESQYSGPGAPHWEGNSLRNPDGSLSAMELPGGQILKTPFSEMIGRLRR